MVVDVSGISHHMPYGWVHWKAMLLKLSSIGPKWQRPYGTSGEGNEAVHFLAYYMQVRINKAVRRTGQVWSQGGPLHKKQPWLHTALGIAMLIRHLNT